MKETRAWEAVRRALGRLASHAAVRALPASALSPPVVLRVAETGVAPPPVASGEREAAWRPAAAALRAAIPQAAAGGTEGDWTPQVRLGEGLAAPAAPLCRAMPIVGAAPGRIVAADLLLPAFVVRLPEAFVALPPAPVGVRAVALLALPGAGVLHGWDVTRPKGRTLRLPRASAPRIRWGGDAVLARMDLARRGLVPPPGIPFATAFAAPWSRLAEASSLPPSDVILLGVYPGVPILAVRRLVVADEGRLLRLWLKPEVLRGRGGSRLITLLVGRQISSGKMLQAVL